MESLPCVAPSEEGKGGWGQNPGTDLLYSSSSNAKSTMCSCFGATQTLDFKMGMHVIVAAQVISQGEYK